MTSSNDNEQTPHGWHISGSHPQEYQNGADRTVRRSGEASGYLMSDHAKPEFFATIMQNMKADRYRGNRVRLSAYVKAEQVTDWAGLWLRVDSIDGETLNFDNMYTRKITGTADWALCENVLDVPEHSVLIAFGLLLSGPGKVWLDDVQLTIVGSEVASTNMPPEDLLPDSQEAKAAEQRQAEYAKALPEKLKRLPIEPVNLNFEM